MRGVNLLRMRLYVHRLYLLVWEAISSNQKCCVATTLLVIVACIVLVFGYARKLHISIRFSGLPICRSILIHLFLFTFLHCRYTVEILRIFNTS